MAYDYLSELGILIVKFRVAIDISRVSETFTLPDGGNIKSFKFQIQVKMDDKILSTARHDCLNDAALMIVKNSPNWLKG